MPKKRKTKNLPYPVVRVEWVDSTGENGWQFVNQLEEGSLKAVSVGFLISETKKSVTIASSFHAGCNQVNAPMTIPKVAISKMSRL